VRCDRQPFAGVRGRRGGSGRPGRGREGRGVYEQPMHFGGITLRYENRHVSSIRHGLQREGSAAREGDFFLGREGLALAADLGFRNFTYWLAIAQTW
jgi:hypothetical protein